MTWKLVQAAEKNDLDGDKEQSCDDESWKGGNDVGGPPGVPQDVQLGEVDADDVGQAVSEVDSPGEYSIGHTATVWAVK